MSCRRCTPGPRLVGLTVSEKLPSWKPLELGLVRIGARPGHVGGVCQRYRMAG